MPKVSPLWPGFSSGELSKRLQSNSSLDTYRSGLSFCKNFVTTPQGSIKKRSGFDFVLSDTDNKTFGNIFSYPISSEREVALVLFEEVLQVLKMDLIDPEINDEFVTIYEPTRPGTWVEFGDNRTRINIPPSGQQVFFLHPSNHPHRLKRIGGHNANDFEIEQVTFVNLPSEWAGDNFPSCGTFFQGRWWLSGCAEDPARIWGSKIQASGGYFDFTTGANPEDAFDLSLDDYGTIRWMKGLKNLLVGTDQGEFIITSENGVVTTSDFQVEQQSAYGSLNRDAVRVGNSVIFITPDGRKLRETRYRWEEDAWTSIDLTFKSEHITLGDNKMIEVGFQQNPDNVLWCNTVNNTTELSTLVACTFERDLGISGFHRHDIQGKVHALDVTIYKGNSIPIILCELEGNGLSVLAMNGPSKMDHYKKATLAAIPSAELSNLEHLANKTVQVIADGSIHPDVLIDNNGEGTLNYEASEVFCGLHQTATIKTLPMDYANQSGSTPSWSKRWNKIFVRLINSHIPLVNGVRSPERNVDDNFNNRPALLEDSDVNVSNLGLDKRGIITVESDIPLDCEITSIFGEMGQNIT